MWLDCSEEQLYPSVYEPTEEQPDVFWYDNGKKAIPLTGDALPADVKFEPIQGEQQSIWDISTEQEVEKPDETYDDKVIDIAESKEKELTLKDVFNELYKYAMNLPKKERKEYYRDNLLPFFPDEERMQTFIQVNLDRKKRNAAIREVRLKRKAYLANFNYFCTFTFDDAKHTEETFKKTLKATFRNLCYRRGWKYVGVWERGEQNRLHFHGLFKIPEGQMVGEIYEFKDYSVRLGKVKITHPNTYFNERFGRSGFEKIDHNCRIGEAIGYITKYIEKTGEKLVYSKGLPQYFVTDVVEDDVVTRMGIDDRKLVLFDDFACYNNRQYVGNVSKETIAKLPTSNR